MNSSPKTLMSSSPPGIRQLGLSSLRSLSRLLRRTPFGRLDAAATVQERLARWLIPPGPFRVGPFLVHVDPRDHLMRKELGLYGAYEPFQVDVFRSVVAPGDVVIDAGAHVGLYTLWASRAVGRSGRIVAFEPDPDNRRLLERNLAVNRVENVDVVPRALTDRRGEAELYQNPTNRANLSLRNPWGFEESVPVETTTLADHFASRQRSPAVVKLDVEGAELLVLEGAGPMFERDPPRAVLTEVAAELLDAFGFEPDDLVRELTGLGLRPFVVDERSRTLVPRRPADLLADVHRRGVRNLLWRREEP